MNYSIVYSSVTGNTAKLAEAINNHLGASYVGKPSNEALNADVIFVGFWATKNSCSADIQAFIEKLTNKKVFIFGTVGYDNTDAYFEEILNNVKALVPASNTIIGAYACQGKIKKKKQEQLREAVPEKYEAIKNNLAESVHHPNEKDIDGLLSAVKAAI